MNLFQKILNTRKKQEPITINLMNGCFVVLTLVMCTIIYLIITHIKWILLGMICLVLVMCIKKIYVSLKNDKQIIDDEYQ